VVQIALIIHVVAVDVVAVQVPHRLDLPADHRVAARCHRSFGEQVSFGNNVPGHDQAPGDFHGAGQDLADLLLQGRDLRRRLGFQVGRGGSGVRDDGVRVRDRGVLRSAAGLERGDLLVVELDLGGVLFDQGRDAQVRRLRERADVRSPAYEPLEDWMPYAPP
jgi:hypothetical protein